MKLLKSCFATTFVDSSAAMIEQTLLPKTETMGPRAKRATLIVADIVEMPEVPSDTFTLILAMGDPLSICSDPQRAANEMSRIARLRPRSSSPPPTISSPPWIITSSEAIWMRWSNSIQTEAATNWLTADEQERFELTNFTPASLSRLFERSGFEVLSVAGKTIIPVRSNKKLLEAPDAMERLLKLEAELSKDSTSAGRAAHLQIVARKAAAVG